ncbi:MAG TPA: hypothetical protein VMI75_21625, partial [Polyangiaceae bacterium]|nr:hypothetical protein [Polyangiaceae bacterium]
ALDPDKHPLTAEHMLAEVGGDALWGGALGGAFGAGKGVLGSALERIRGAPEVARAYGEGAGRESTRQAIEGLTDEGDASPDEPKRAPAIRPERFNSDLYEMRQVPIASVTDNRDVWSADKLADAQARLAAGEAMPPIRLGGEAGVHDGYSVADGIHRLNAAEQAGYPNIWAIVDKETPHFEGPLTDALTDARSPSSDDVAAVAGKGLQATPATGLGAAVKRWYAQLSGAVSGKAPEDIEGFIGGAFDPESAEYRNRQRLLEADQARDDASRSIRENVDQILKSSRAVMEEGDRSIKRSHIDALVTEVDRSEAAESARNMWDQTASVLQSMMADPEKFGGQAPLKSAWTVARQIGDKLESAITSGDIGEQYALLDDLKKGIGKYTRGASQLSPRAAVDELAYLQNKARAAHLQDLYETLRAGLEDETTWKAAGTAQKAINDAWSRQIEASDRFHRALTTYVGRDPNNPWVNIRGVDPAKSDAYVRNLLNPNQDLTHAAVVDYVDSTRALANSMAEQWELPPEKIAQVKQLGEAADRFRSTLDETAKSLALTNQFERLRADATGHAHNYLAGAAYLAGGVHAALPMAIAGRVVRMVTRPADTIMALARIEGMVRKSRGTVGRALRGFVRGSEATSKGLSVDAYPRLAARTRRALSARTDTVDRMQRQTAIVHQFSPGLARALGRISVTGLATLEHALPVEPPRDPLAPDAPTPEPSPSQKLAFLRTYRAVTDPHSVLEDLQAGRVNVEGVRVMQQVYPNLYADVQQATLSALASRSAEPLTRQQRIGLGLLLQLPSPTLAPAYVQARQAIYAPAPPSSPPQSGAAKSRRSKPIDLSSIQSSADRVESGPEASR